MLDNVLGAVVMDIKHVNEKARLQELYRYEILDTQSEKLFDELAQLASYICGTPTSLVTFIDEDRVWYKSKVGCSIDESRRELSLCSHTIEQDELFIFSSDSASSHKYEESLRAHNSSVKFYVGVPLKNERGHNLGTLCVMDKVVRDISEEQKKALIKISKQVVSQLELRKKINRIEVLSEENKMILNNLTEKNKELNDFAYSVSHDLKAPLRGIRSLAELIKEDTESSLSLESKRYFKLLQARVFRLDSNIASILSYSRAGRVEKSFENIDLNYLVDNIWRSLSPPENAELTKSKLPMLFAPRTIFEQVFQNLISNAIKYNDKDQVKIRLKFKQSLNHFEFILSDNGPGILEKYHDRVFEIFQTLQSKDKIEGSGLGLAIVKRLVKKNNGQIWITSPPGQGCSFHVMWPKTVFNVISSEAPEPITM